EMLNVKYDEDKVFMICMIVHWKDDSEPLKQICLVDVETASEPDPDIYVGFNNSQYNWWFIVEKANKLGVLEWMFNHISFKPLSLEKIIKWEYQYNIIKINDGKFYSKNLKIPGCVAIDGIKELDSISAKQIREVAKYYIIDALSCQRLIVKYNAINKYRGVAFVAFLSLFDAHYFAGGMKVCNLLSASAWQRGILTNMISRQQTKTRKYPEAYIFPPVKGLENKYPSLRDSGKKLHEINFKFNSNNILAWSIKHNNIPEEKEKNEDMELVIGLMCKDLSLSEAIEHILAKAEEEKRDSLNKNLYYFINKENINSWQNKITTTGDSKSPFFLRELAGNVTSAGQRNIKLVADFVKSKGF
ncbi:1084_t:CDS:2, partial [Funneliformis geosporum]